MSKSSVIRAIKSLEETGLIKVERGEGHSNIYTLLRVEKIKKPGKKRSESTHHQIIDFFYKTTQKTRRMRPTISGADVKNLKRVLESGVVSSTQLEQVILYFLASRHFKKFSPHISTILSAGVLNGIVNRMKNDSEFWRELEQMQIYYFSSDTMNDPEAVKQNKNIALKRNVNLLARSMSIGTL